MECGAPDFLVSRRSAHGPVTIGYIETKDVGIDLQSIEVDSERPNPSTRDGQQLSRYRAGIDNLILTNYHEFRWYVDGRLRMTASLASTDVHGRLRLHQSGTKAVVELLQAFTLHHVETVSSPRELAERMARVTRLTRDAVIGAFENNVVSGQIRDLHEAFRDVLIPGLTIEQFADMFAQTLAYGLFAARVGHQGSTGPFRRYVAAYEVPRTNPFLRRLFAAVSGPELDEEPFAVFVDDLAQLLDRTDMTAVLADFGKRTRQEDPVVHFYETFLAAYDPHLRERRGVYYTPEPVVSYMVRSVDSLLKSKFGCTHGLADSEMITYRCRSDSGEEVMRQGPRVLILDPACGTGTFLYAIVDLIRESFMSRQDAGKWSAYVRSQLLPRLFGFELLMAPYAIAHLKLGLQLAGKDLPAGSRHEWVYDSCGHERLGIYLTNSLEKAAKQSELLLGSYISEEANAASEVKRDLPIMVVLGNPPYSGHSANKGEWITGLVADYKRGVPGLDRPAQAKWLQDDYVKFLRFGQWRIERSGAGILAFVTNHGYLDNPTFRGMRKQLMDAFDDIYILNLHGNTKKQECTPAGGVDENIFDIQQGVAISIFLKRQAGTRLAEVHYADLWGTRDRKYAWLTEHDVEATAWRTLVPDEPFFLFVPQNADLRAEYEQGWRLPEIMNLNGYPAPGIVTTHDEFAISWNATDAEKKIARFLSTRSEEEARTIWRLCGQSQWNYEQAKAHLSSSNWQSRILPILYRPFDVRRVVFDPHVAVHRRERVMYHMLAGDNVGLVTVRSVEIARGYEHVFCTRMLVQHHTGSVKEVSYLFPIYLYPGSTTRSGVQNDMTDLYPWPAGKDGRRPNLNAKFVADFERQLRMKFISDGRGDLRSAFGPEDVFHYIYAILHSQSYRERYREFFRMDFPRIPLTSNRSLFHALAFLGGALASAHLMESSALAQPITRYPIPGDNLVGNGYPRYVPPGTLEPGTGRTLSHGRVYTNGGRGKTGTRGQYFEGVPPEVWEFCIGGYQVCEKWLKDRRGRVLTFEDITHYEQIIVAISETIRLMKEIDEVIEDHGGWPIE